ncbi:MAG TPA: DUF4845 domain-containing protein [Rudaea sp.]|jgi:Tfp pilus assembly major pilin PilA|nr:DUF4845 domain-containing protein [Rudaea sp.]
MNMKNRQHGITLMGFAILLIVVGFFAYAAMKLWPAYIEYYGVVKSMKVLQSEAGIETASLAQIRQKLNVQFDLQYVEESDIPASGFQLNTQNGAHSLTITWDKDVPFIYNVDFLVHFTNTVDLSRGATY